METVGTDERATTGSVIDRLIAAPQGYNLFQAISLLERAAAQSEIQGGTGNVFPRVQLRSVVSLGFQASDVSRVEQGGAAKVAYTLHTPVLSLAGAGGPLPLPFTELVLERTAVRDHATADFLNIFNQRYISFLFRGRKKHNIGLNGHAPEASPLATCLDSLSTLGLKAGVRGPDGVMGWLEHAGLMGGAPRSMEGLLVLLSHRLKVRATGRQFCGAWRQLEDRDVLRLNTRHRGPRLGSSAVLGRRVWDQSAGIQIQLKHMTLTQFRRLLRGGEDHALMQWLVRRYLPQDLDVEVELSVEAGEVRPSELGVKSGLRLGLTSWLTTVPLAQAAPARFRL